jgi:predicted ATPase
MKGYLIDPPAADDQGIVTVTMSGSASFETIAALLRELEARAPRWVLVDQTELRPGAISPAQVRRLADLWKGATALKDARIAAYSPNLVIFGLNRMFQLLANSEDRVAVFKGRAEAIAWLLEQA